MTGTAVCKAGISGSAHYLPLHSSPGGRAFGRASGALPVSERVSECIARLPIWVGLEPSVPAIVERVLDFARLPDNAQTRKAYPRQAAG